MKFLLLILFVSCGEMPKSEYEIKEEKTQKMNNEYLSTLNGEEKIFIQSCLSSYNPLYRCIEKYKSLGKPKIAVHKSEGTSIVKTAVGTAIGVGAVKLLTE